MSTSATAHGQSGYYNLDSGRPIRAEDATPTARYELELQLPTLRVERYDEGTFRWRVEPKFSFGVLPFTELEVRIPVVRVLPRAPAPTVTGIASVGIGALHALNIETRLVPAFAISGDVSLPVGSLAAPRAAYAVKVIATKSLPLVRLHLNVAGGSWNVAPPSSSQPPPPTCGTGAPGVPPCELPPIPPDLPCTVIPLEAAGSATTVAAHCAAAAMSTPAAAVFTPRTSGSRWMAAFAIDHALPLESTLFAVDVIAERFYGLYPLTDWTAEAGLRRQLTPQLVADVGVSRRFRGSTTSTSVTLGFTYGFAVPLLRSLMGGK